MNSLTWLCSRARDWSYTPSTLTTSPLPEQDETTALLPTRSGNPEDKNPMDRLVRHFEENQRDLSTLRQELEQCQANFVRLAGDLQNHKGMLAKANGKNQSQRQQILALEAKVKKSQAAGLQLHQSHVRESQANATIKRLESELLGMRKVAVDNAKALEGYLAMQEDLQQRLSQTQAKLSEVSFEVEYMKCVSKEATVPRGLIPSPFVVVLVDGDAYLWEAERRTSGHAFNAGAAAAFQLRGAVADYISGHPEINPACRIIVRHFFNGAGRIYVQRQNIRNMGGLNSTRTARQFTEAEPLFDSFDCGTGKERADQKIKENFSIFLPNPMCQHIFLAVCTDNGFARMLEPYIHSTVRKKVTLVHPGFMGREIDRLGMEAVQWPAVFEKQLSPPNPRGTPLRNITQAAGGEQRPLVLEKSGIKDEMAAARIREAVVGSHTWLADSRARIARSGVYISRPREHLAAKEENGESDESKNDSESTNESDSDSSDDEANELD